MSGWLLLLVFLVGIWCGCLFRKVVCLGVICRSGVWSGFVSCLFCFRVGVWMLLRLFIVMVFLVRCILFGFLRCVMG